MTAREIERLATVEAQQKDMANDVIEVKADVKTILARLDTMSGENKMLKYLIGVLLAIGGILAGAVHFITNGK
jgi:hypothetical protein